MSPVAVVGIGNNLLQDDGVGIHALEHFKKHYADNRVACVDAGTLGLGLLDRLSNLDGLIAIDAMRLGKSPGTVTVLQNEAMDEHLRNHQGSVHEVGLSDILDALRLCEDLPARRALVGIEPASMDWGTELTEAVAAAIPQASGHIRDLVQAWSSRFVEEAAV